jgi:hypothetical protein
MEKKEEELETYRALHRSWPNELSDTCIFADCQTLDPVEVWRSWSTLSKSTWEMEVAGLPALMHLALLAALKREAGRPAKKAPGKLPEHFQG